VDWRNSILASISAFRYMLLLFPGSWALAVLQPAAKFLQQNEYGCQQGLNPPAGHAWAPLKR
jgi:hypothetical protein